MKTLTTCALALFSVAGMLSATPVTVTADLVNAGTPVEKDSKGYIVGPYTLSVKGVDYAALCVDFSDNATLGQKYSAYETQLGGSLSNTYNPTFTKQYEEEAYLLSLILQPNADRADIQDAAWSITDSGYKASSAAEKYVTLAQENYQSVNYGQFDIISDTYQCWGRTQEFIIDPSASTATPEPASMLLMGGGLVVAGLARRKMAKKA